MNTIRKVWLFVCYVVLGLLPAALFAQPVYTGNAFDSMQEVTDDATLFFGVIIVIAILVTGFFLGRRWLRRVG